MALFMKGITKGVRPLITSAPPDGRRNAASYNKNAEVSIDHFGVFQLITV